jgi:hypothetical protein
MPEIPKRIDWWSLSDEQLLAQCETDRYRASGPGGQKRNKTDSAVRLRHQPTGLIVTAADSRSQHQNRARAVERLRAALAFDLRQPIESREPPDFVRVCCAAGRLNLREKDGRFLPVAAWVLDLLAAHEGAVAETAERLGVSTGNLVRFLETSPDGWQAANRIRQAAGHKPLRGD